MGYPLIYKVSQVMEELNSTFKLSKLHHLGEGKQFKYMNHYLSSTRSLNYDVIHI